MTEDQNVFQFQQKYITQSGIKDLKDVNLTYEFFNEYQEILISRKVAIISKHLNIRQTVIGSTLLY